VPSGENITDEDRAVLEEMRSYPEKIAASIEKYRFREAAAEMMNLARLGNKYLAESEPWKVVKTDAVRTEAIMYTALQIAASLTTMCEPFVPFAAEKLAQMMNIEAPRWDDVSTKDVLVETGHKIGEVSLLFEKIEDEAIDFQLKKLEKARLENIAAAKAKEPAKEVIAYDDFAKMDIRVGTILAAEKVAKAKKLLKLTIDTGLDVRTVVSGIAESFSPEDVIGRRVCVLVNLAPREIRGITSNGMILMTEYPDGRLEFVAPMGDVPNGAAIS
jgi:methionyl-tRNA synthetase